MKRIAAGILAHVDAGKTTLTEALLYGAGEIRKLGHVDHGDAFLDGHELERSRGITIFSKQAVLHTDEAEITLLDTPGHTDFSAEAERVLQVLDCAVLLISGIDGVQSHTETLWRLLKCYHVPVFIFVNKMDISESSREALISELQKRLDGCCTDFSASDGGALRGEAAEAAALCGEDMMQAFLETGEIPAPLIREAIRRRRIFPCFFGSALRLGGTEQLLRCLSSYAQEPVYGENFAARVFKITEDAQGNRLTHLKVTGGSLRVRMQIGEGESAEKISAVRIYSGSRFRTAEEVPAGTVCAVTGLTKTFAGQGLGTAADAPLPMLEPLFSYRVELPPEVDAVKGLAMLRKLEEEDPQLRVAWNEQLREIHVQLMGEIQLEVLKSVIKERFGIEVGFGKGSIAYRETVAAPVLGAGHYEPLRHYAEVQLLIEPGERGSGVRYASECREDKLDRNWQRLIISCLAAEEHVGVLTGSPLTDVKITLIAGRAHLKHTEGGDFRQAARRAVCQGLRCAENVLLEPWYGFRLQLPASAVGRAMSDLTRMGAEFTPPETSGDEAVIEGAAPAALLSGYQSDVTAYTRGTGRLYCFPEGYRPCKNAEEIIAETGYDPDSDTENPADSVFCSHGAGHIVKWDEVRGYLHTYAEQGDEREAQSPSPARINDFKRQKATDKELIEIFERTYGKIKRDERTAVRREPSAEKAPKPWKAAALPEGPDYLLVDGYNIIFAWEELSKAAKESLDLARSMLINTLCNYRGWRRCEVIAVFDAYKVKGNRGEVEQISGITVVYTKEAETADMYIEKATRTLGKKHRVRVATSDRLEQLIILGSGAQRMSAAELKAEIDEAEKAIREHISGES